eukprot:gene2356-2584_t
MTVIQDKDFKDCHQPERSEKQEENSQGGGYRGAYPPGCDTTAAAQCEYQFLLCKLFNGPANDATTLCSCAKQFFGDCIRQAGCTTSPEVGSLTDHQLYIKVCIDFIIEYNCPDPLICGINCASDGNIDTTTTKVLPFNNYGDYYLRVKPCLYSVHQVRYDKYSMVYQAACTTIDEFEACNRFVPPSSFVPVAVPINTTYIEIDSCVYNTSATTTSNYTCYSSNPSPVRVYGNKYLFPTSYDSNVTSSSICSSDDDCLGSFCDDSLVPALCSPKTIKQVTGTGSNYMNTN